MKKLLLVLSLLLGAASVQADQGIIQYSTTASTFTTGPGNVYQVVLGTGPAGQYVVLRDSATANTSSTPMLPRLFYSSVQTETVITLDPPVHFSNGLSVNISTNTTEAWVRFRRGEGRGSSRIYKLQ